MKYAIATILLILLFIADVMWGSSTLHLDQVLVEGTADNAIFFSFRLPKALAAVMVGISLAVSGLLMQTIFRNPLAGPYMLGVSSGASLGVALFMLAGGGFVGFEVLQQMGMAAAAWAGSVAVLMLVMVVSARLKDIMAVLILGMMLGGAASAFVDVLQFFSNEAALKGFVVWSMGSLGGVSTDQLAIMGVCVVVGLALAWWCVKKLDLMLLGENYARTMGVRIGSTRAAIFLATSLLAGSVTAFCGPVAFVGIAAPHVARMVFRRASHRTLLPASLIVGANMMLLCDLLSTLPGTDMVLPLNTVTSLLGIPVVVMVVVGSRNYKIM